MWIWCRLGPGADFRRVPAAAFFTDLLQTALEPQEIIAAVEIPLTKRLGAIDENFDDIFLGFKAFHQQQFSKMIRADMEMF